jgi:thioesterase superfamily protein
VASTPLTSPEPGTPEAGTSEPGTGPEGDRWALIVTAFDLNRTHRRLGTTLVAVAADAVTIALDWPDELGPATSARWPRWVVAALLDHSASLAAVAAAGELGRIGGTMNLGVDYLRPPVAGSTIRVTARCDHLTDDVAFTTAVAYHPASEGETLATGTSALGVVGRRR